MDPFSYSSPSSSSSDRALSFIPPPLHLGPDPDESEPSDPAPSIGPIEKEHMFDKVVTPSDVGKLNRLVIPKQHAEKYFPLDSSSNEKGLLLNFEDRTGKPWRFRYSYWNSSQSYVMTKGWSRFVKEKKLDAGDVVSFQRGVGEAGKDRLFIDWRRRPDHHHHHHGQPPLLHRHFSAPWGPRNGYFSSSGRSGSNSGFNYGFGNVVNFSSTPFFYLSRSSHVAPPMPPPPPVPVVFDSVPVVQGKAAAKRLRLFGVNMDCPISSDSGGTNIEHRQEFEILNSTSVSHAVTIGSQVQLISGTAASSSESMQNNPHHLQLRLYNGMPLMNKGKTSSSSSSMSLDLDI